MLHGLIWLPLLALFIGLAWAGRTEFQKLEVYRQWAAPFQRAKYDVYAVLGQQGDRLTWGKPTKQGIVTPETFSLSEVKAIQLLVNGRAIDLEAPPKGGKSIELEFQLPTQSIRVPFTQVSLATQWAKVLIADWQTLHG
jgi:hypothetical protein